VTLHPDAREMMKEFFARKSALKRAQKDDSYRSTLSKMSGYVLKFALIIHEARKLDEGGSNIVSPDTMARAIEICEWAIHEMGRVYRSREDVACDQDDRETDRLVRMARRKAGITARMAGKNFRIHTRDAEAKLEELVVAQKLRRTTKTSTKGRESTWYHAT
jgi:Protein of unknown function (DUF3987)